MLGEGRHELAVLGRAHLHPHVAPEVGPEALKTSSRDITIFTGRLALREREGQRLEIDDGLAAEAAADLGGGDADLGDVQAQQARAVGPHDEVALGAAPELGRAVLGDAGQGGVRLDVALMDRRGLELALDDDIGLLEAGLDVAQGDLDALGDVGGLLGLGLDAAVKRSSCRSGAPGCMASTTSIT